MNYLWVFLGGGLGAAMRYWLSGAVYRLLSSSFPYGTLVVNVIGCFVIGLWMSLFTERFAGNPALRVFLVIGILGGFTTFSSFSYETIALIRDGQIVSAILNIGLSVVICLLATWIGLETGKLF